MIKELFASEGTEGDNRGFERWLYRLWLKPIARPRGDQTKGGTVIPGLSDDSSPRDERKAPRFEAPREKGRRD